MYLLPFASFYPDSRRTEDFKARTFSVNVFVLYMFLRDAWGWWYKYIDFWIFPTTQLKIRWSTQKAKGQHLYFTADDIFCAYLRLDSPDFSASERYIYISHCCVKLVNSFCTIRHVMLLSGHLGVNNMQHLTSLLFIAVVAPSQRASL